MKTQTRKEKRKIAFWVSLDSQGIGLIGCSGEGLKLDRGKVRLGAELPTGARLGHHPLLILSLNIRSLRQEITSMDKDVEKR